MTFAQTRTGVRVTGRLATWLPVLLLAAVLAVAAGGDRPAWAGEAANGHETGAREPLFDLPPIMVNVQGKGNVPAKTIVLKTALVFDEVDEDRINDSQRLAKALLPKIMDSVITGVQKYHAVDASDAAGVDKVILERAVAVLRPYGVLIKSLRVENLSGR